MKISTKERTKRLAVAKALWFLEIGDDKPEDPSDVQAAFDNRSDEMVTKAIQFEVLLGRLDYSFTST